MLGESSLKGLRRQGDEVIPAAITDVGCEREINEDRYAVIDSTAGRAWVVCDGMGGVMGGELAAQLAIDAIRRALTGGEFETPDQALRTALEEANRVIVLRRQNPAFSGMGATVVAALVSGDQVVVANAGDSRAYLVRRNEIQQLTTDHTYVQDLVDRGVIAAEEALNHPQAHVLTKCLGAEPRLDMELSNYWVWDTDEASDDKLVLCSDGLYSLLSDQEMVEIIASQPIQEACVTLVEKAKERGGYDNITLAILPLSGQLREESAVPEAGKKKRSTPSKAAKREIIKPVLPELSFAKRMLLLALLGIVGSMFAVLAVLLSLR